MAQTPYDDYDPMGNYMPTVNSRTAGAIDRFLINDKVIEKEKCVYAVTMDVNESEYSILQNDIEWKTHIKNKLALEIAVLMLSKSKFTTFYDPATDTRKIIARCIVLPSDTF